MERPLTVCGFNSIDIRFPLGERQIYIPSLVERKVKVKVKVKVK